MQLIGMLDSPYVRRVAISLQLLDLPFEHRALSVFRTFDEFAAINPVVKAPSLVCDDGEVLMDSTLILEYAERLAAPDKSLMPGDPAGLQNALRIIGLALAACEKSVQILYEHELRPEHKRHDAWLSRVTGQLHSAYDALEAEIDRQPLAVGREEINQAGITAAVAWYFTQHMIPGVVDPDKYPALKKHSARAEQLPEFEAAPYGLTEM